MASVIHITDIHINGKNPIARKDSLNEIQFEKLEEIVKVSNSLTYPIIITGDLFDIPISSYNIFSRLAEIFSKSKYGIYVVIGNHDLKWYSITSLNSTTLGGLISSGVIKHIREFEKDYNFPLDYCDWDQKIVRNNSEVLISHKAVISSFIQKHSNWMKEENSDFWIDTNSDLRDYRLILCGHYHKQYVFSNQKQNLLVINPGSLTRRSANPIESHFPSYAIVDLENSTYEICGLNCGSIITDVIDDSHLDFLKSKKNMNSEISELIQKLNTYVNRENRNTNAFKTILIESLKTNVISDSAKEIIREFMSEIFGTVSFDSTVKRHKLRSK